MGQVSDETLQLGFWCQNDACRKAEVPVTVDSLFCCEAYSSTGNVSKRSGVMVIKTWGVESQTFTSQRFRCSPPESRCSVGTSATFERTTDVEVDAVDLMHYCRSQNILFSVTGHVYKPPAVGERVRSELL